MIYENVQYLCKQQGISIAECERRAGLGNGVIAGWKTAAPRIDKLQAVANVLHVSLETIVGGLINETA